MRLHYNKYICGIFKKELLFLKLYINILLLHINNKEYTYIQNLNGWYFL